METMGNWFFCKWPTWANNVNKVKYIMAADLKFQEKKKLDRSKWPTCLALSKEDQKKKTL